MSALKMCPICGLPRRSPECCAGPKPDKDVEAPKYITQMDGGGGGGLILSAALILALLIFLFSR